MSDYISRQDAIDALRNNRMLPLGDHPAYNRAMRDGENVIRNLPSAQPESRREWYMKGYRDAQDAALHESCTDCPLYDHDRHRCPRFNKVIPTTIQEILDTHTQRWIPVTERLPGENDYKSCIECFDGAVWHGAVWYFTENGTMGLGYYYKSTKEWSTTDDLKTDGKVVAWMPLPEPYREEEKHD